MDAKKESYGGESERRETVAETVRKVRSSGRGGKTPVRATSGGKRTEARRGALRPVREVSRNQARTSEGSQ